MPSLLIGENQTDLSQSMHDYFSLRHYSVQVESNGRRVLEHLTAKTYDVVILDIALPNLDGISIVRDYRANRGAARKYCQDPCTDIAAEDRFQWASLAHINGAWTRL